MADITLTDIAATERLGHILADCIQRYPELHILLLHGPLGSGKTTLVRFIVEALPHGELAEVASPSFTLCHHYPTIPPVEHHDLYRTPQNLPEELLDGLENPKNITIVEWAGYLLEKYTPQHYLDIFLQPCSDYRTCTVHAHGARMEAIRCQIYAQWLEKPHCLSD